MKTFLRRRGKIVLRPANPTMDELVFDPADVQIYGKVVTRAAPPLNRGGYPDARPRYEASTSAQWRRSAVVHVFACGVRDLGVAGTEVARRDPVRGEAGDVGPPELRPHTERPARRRAPRPADRARFGGAAGRRVQHLDLVGVAERAPRPRRRPLRAGRDGA